MSGFLSELSARGLVHQVMHPEELQPMLDAGGMTLYCGFDPTADSLHVGSLFPALILRRFQLAGHRPIAVVGGGTGFIGDPSGKSDERSLLSREKLEANLAGIQRQLERFLDFDRGARLVNNADWLCKFSLIDFLRDVGKRFTVNTMLEKESVRARLEDREQGISFTEFTYMLLQAYDFLHLYDTEGCTLQVGGSDQWGNITLGADLIRRVRAQRAWGLTFPLLTKSDGTKFGKSEKGTVWLDPKLTSPYQFYQFFIRVEDAEVVRMLHRMTFLSLEEIAALGEQVATRPEAREAQKRLASELTILVHGKDELARVEHASQVLFGGSLESLDERTLLEVFAEAPSSGVSRARFEAGVPLVDLLVESGLCSSKGMARKDLAGNGIYLNNQKVTDRSLTTADFVLGRYVLLRKGRKNYHLIRTE